jgi:hypothetical protein
MGWHRNDFMSIRKALNPPWGRVDHHVKSQSRARHYWAVNTVIAWLDKACGTRPSDDLVRRLLEQSELLREAKT